MSESEDEIVDIDDVSRRMDSALQALKSDLSTLRTGRATVSMLDSVEVIAYGSKATVQQCCTVSIPEAKVLLLNVWDKSLVGDIEKALRNADLGFSITVDGSMIRTIVPDLSEERRKDLMRTAGKFAESSRIALRNVRRGAMEKLKQLQLAGLSEDEGKKIAGQIQDITDQHIRKVAELLEEKENQIMKV